MNGNYKAGEALTGTGEAGDRIGDAAGYLAYSPSGVSRNSMAIMPMVMSPGWRVSVGTPAAIGLILMKGGSSGSAQISSRLLPNHRLILSMRLQLPAERALHLAPQGLGDQRAERYPAPGAKASGKVARSRAAVSSGGADQTASLNISTSMSPA